MTVQCPASAFSMSSNEQLKLRAEGKMFSHDDAERNLESANYLWLHAVPDAMYGRKLISPKEDDDLVDAVPVLHDTPDDENNDDIDKKLAPKPRPTIFDADNAFPDNPMLEDLNKSTACQALSDYTTIVEEQVLAASHREGDDDEETKKFWDNVEPILEHEKANLCCDGVPAAMLLRKKIQDPSSVPQEVASGGFHFLLHACKACGALFALSHLDAFFGCWRKTDKQRKYVLDNPGDPDQTADEAHHMTIGVLSDAIEASHRDKNCGRS